MANGKQTTIAQVAEIVRKASGTIKPIRFNGAERKGDPINWEADISTVKRWGYEPSIELETGINHYIKWVREYA